MTLPNYTQFGGFNPETAGLAHLLSYHGVVSPHDKKPFSEAMLLGIAGGVGGGYWLFEFGDQANVYVGTRHLWQSPKLYVEKACQRLGVTPAFKETSGAKAAEKHLAEALAAGHPALVWVDLAHMPYAGLPKSLSGMLYHFVVVYGMDEAGVQLADRAPHGLTVTRQELSTARSRISSNKNRLMTIDPPAKKIDLKSAILDGIRIGCVELNKPKVANFGLPAIAKWADLVNHPKDKKGWPQVFAEGNHHFYGALRWCFVYLEIYQSPGMAFRGMYADFLEQAAVITRRPALAQAAAQYRALAAEWRALSHAFLPDTCPPLKKLRELLEENNAAREAGAPLEQIAQRGERIAELQQGFRDHPPYTSADRAALFADLQVRIRRIHAAEVEACEALAAAAG